jgi:hypothetical protein
VPRNPLKPRLPPKNKATGRRRKKRYKNDGSRPQHGDTMRRLWQDPEFRAKMAARDKRCSEARKRDPLKYTRIGVPDGLTKAKAKPLWDRAYALADQFIQILKDTGRL